MRVRMPFQGRYERFRKLQREKMGEQITDRAPCDEMEKGDGLEEMELPKYDEEERNT